MRITYYEAQLQQSIGPIDFEEMVKLATVGTIDLETSVKTDIRKDWHCIKDNIDLRLVFDGVRYCRTCGHAAHTIEGVCQKCGIRPLNANKFCQSCGCTTVEKQEMCVKCGSALVNMLKISSFQPVLVQKDSAAKKMMIWLVIAFLSMWFLGLCMAVVDQ